MVATKRNLFAWQIHPGQIGHFIFFEHQSCNNQSGHPGNYRYGYRCLITGAFCFACNFRIRSSTLARWLDIGRHLVLPAFTLAILLFGSYVLVVRNSSLEVLAEEM